MAKHGLKQLIHALKRSRLENKPKGPSPETFIEIAQYLDMCLSTSTVPRDSEQILLDSYRPDLKVCSYTNDPERDHEKIHAFMRNEAGFKLMMHDEIGDAQKRERRDVAFSVHVVTSEMLNELSELSDRTYGKQEAIEKVLAVNGTARYLYKREWR